MRSCARLLLLLVVASCSTFEATGADEAARGCPKPAKENTKCWDFEDGASPAGDVEKGNLSLDDKTFYSSGHSLVATTSDQTAPSEAWARLAQPFATPPKIVMLDQRVLLTPQGVTEFGEIKIKSDKGYWTLHLEIEDGKMKALEATFDSTKGDQVVDGTYLEHTLGTFTAGAWTRIQMRVDLTDYPAKRRVVLTVGDGPASVDRTDDEHLEVVGSGQLVVYAGITYVSAYSKSQPSRRLSFDDILVSWTP